MAQGLCMLCMAFPTCGYPVQRASKSCFIRVTFVLLCPPFSSLGVTYWYNRGTGQSTWERPTGEDPRHDRRSLYLG